MVELSSYSLGARARDTQRARGGRFRFCLSEHSISRVVLASYLAHQDARC
jgi:hypothetical protein